jgi:hypothetical protein
MQCNAGPETPKRRIGRRVGGEKKKGKKYTDMNIGNKNKYVHIQLLVRQGIVLVGAVWSLLRHCGLAC